MTEIKVQRKPGPRKKWPWLLLLFIPIIWLVMNKGAAPGEDGEDAGDSTKAKPTATAPRPDRASKDTSRTPPDTTKKPPV